MIELNNFTYKTNRILFEGANFITPSIGIIGIAGEWLWKNHTLKNYL